MSTFQRKSSNYAQWNWQPAVGYVKQTVQGEHLIMNLQPTLAASGSQQLNLRVDTERELQHSSELGWNWHKSWNLPNISIKLSLLVGDQIQDASWPQCQAQILAVKRNSEGIFEDVGLDGSTVQDLVDGKAFFSKGIKFNSTTYNHQGHRFNIIILIKHNGQLIVSLISPQVFVDSRKSARDEHRQMQHIQPFDPKYLEKNFCKKEKHINDIVDAPIENNETGLHNYLTAPNIRNKIKHPLFLAIKFSRCFAIYRKTGQRETQPIMEFQRALMKRDGSNYLIVFQSNNNRIKKKIEESLTQLFLQSKMLVVEKRLAVLEGFERLEFIDEGYKACYHEICDEMSKMGELGSESDEISHPKKAFRQFDKLPTTTFSDEPAVKKQVKVEDEQIDHQVQPQQCGNLNIQQYQQLMMQQQYIKDNYLRFLYLQQQMAMQMLYNQIQQ